MIRAARILLRLTITVLSLSAVVLLLGGSLWYVLLDARGRAPEVGYQITARKLEQAAIGLYLRYRGPDATLPANPQDDAEVTFVVDYGDPVGVVGYKLERLGLVRDGELFRRVVQYHGTDGDIQAGVYLLRPSMTMEEIMRTLQHGRLESAWITVPEGWRSEQIAALLEGQGIVLRDAFLAAVWRGRQDFSFLLDRPEGAPMSLEGYLFPDTYQLPKETTPERVIDVMLQNWDRRIPQALRQKALERGMTLYEVLTLASIVEREAVRDVERPLIASVYLNRLEQGMHLQADPTVQYAKGYSQETDNWWNPMIQEEAITVVSPYNTFLKPGLPPGPICNPGASSIRAVLEPAESEYLFFYSKGDGYHAFAVTYEEHLRNQELYRARE